MPPPAMTIHRIGLPPFSTRNYWRDLSKSTRVLRQAVAAIHEHVEGRGRHGRRPWRLRLSRCEGDQGACAHAMASVLDPCFTGNGWVPLQLHPRHQRTPPPTKFPPPI